MSIEEESDPRQQTEEALSDYRIRLERMVRASTEQALRIQSLLHKTKESERALRESEGRYRDLAEQRKLLLSELSHRVKNTLATVQSIIAQTYRHHPDPEEFARALDGRIRMLANAHSMLTRSEWKGASMADVVRSIVGAYPQYAAGGIRAEGPALNLPASHVLSLSMLLHELATNALKYGALQNSHGTIDITWREKDHHVGLDWRESGGPPVTPPTHKGFGTSFINRVVSYELRGQSDLSFEPEGVACSIEFDLPTPRPAPVAAAAPAVAAATTPNGGPT